MSTGIVNPYATNTPLTYEEECLADNPIRLFMMDETSGTTGLDQGSVASDLTWGANSPTL